MNAPCFEGHPAKLELQNVWFELSMHDRLDLSIGSDFAYGKSVVSVIQNLTQLNCHSSMVGQKLARCDRESFGFEEGRIRTSQ